MEKVLRVVKKGEDDSNIKYWLTLSYEERLCNLETIRQGVINRFYATDRGEGQQWNLAPGNLYSTPIKVKFDPSAQTKITLVLDKTIPPIKEPEDTKYVKHIKIQSKLLTEFWGCPMFIGAHVLLPEGFDEHPSVHYPLAIYHGHFPSDLSGFRTTPACEIKLL